jgi:hypothetical protein
MAKRKLLILGILSPILAIVFYILVYNVLSALSSNLEKDWLFRLTASALSMTIPFVIVLLLAIRAGRQGPLPLSAKIGIAIAVLSLGLTLLPARDGFARAKQTRNRELHDVAAPDFATRHQRNRRAVLGEALRRRAPHARRRSRDDHDLAALPFHQRLLPRNIRQANGTMAKLSAMFDRQ